MDELARVLKERKVRCVNIDWLEVYCLESNDRYPCNADYFRERGYFVKEREYGTRVYKEMFTIEDNEGHPWLEIRRNPAAGGSDFSGLIPQSCHIRLVNAQCYVKDCIERLRQFLLLHDYIFQKIFRIDICYDFIRFDSGDDPEKFAQRYLMKKYRKINQGLLSVHGEDSWTAFDWQSLSWGAPTSMVSTKMYDKTVEMSVPKNDKPYIRYAWFEAHLIDDPIGGGVRLNDGSLCYPHVWRVEFSMKASARNWLVIESQGGKREKKKRIEHRLDLFDSPDKLWQRFQNLSFHYFHFKYFEPDKRKDRCKDKKLFFWNRECQFLQLEAVPPKTTPDRDDTILLRRLQKYKVIHLDPEIQKACAAIIDAIKTNEVRRLTPHNISVETQALQRAIAIRCGGKEEDIMVTVERVKELLLKGLIF